MTDRRLPACAPELLRAKPIASVDDLRRHTLLHSATTSPAWSEWLILAGTPHLRPLHHMEFEHVHLQLEAAVSGLGIALASLRRLKKTSKVAVSFVQFESLNGVHRTTYSLASIVKRTPR